MSSRSATRCKVLALLIGTTLGACSDIYYDRRETIALGADDHIAANAVVQMVDPWPHYVGNKNIAFDGMRMQTAVERYRHNKVIPPVNATTTSIAQQQAQQQAAATSGATSHTTQPAPAAPVR